MSNGISKGKVYMILAGLVFSGFSCNSKADSDLSVDNKPDPIAVTDHPGTSTEVKVTSEISETKPDPILLEKKPVETIEKETIEEVKSQELKESQEKVAEVKKEVKKKEVIKETKKEVIPIVPKKEIPVVRAPSISFTEPIYSFDTITEGDIIDHVFTFKNTGNADLNLAKVVPGCGCTLPTYPFIEIRPGESNEIKVKYNSVSKQGPQKSVITVYSDDPDKGAYEIALVGYVKEKEKE